MNMGTIKQAGKKKLAVVTLASAVVLGSMGTGAYAFKDDLIALFDKAYTHLNPGVQKAITDKEAELKGTIANEVRTEANARWSALSSFSQGVVARETAELEAYKTAYVNSIKAKADSEQDRIEAKLDSAANATTEQSKADIKAAIDAEIAKYK
jgi:hypothetical protein